MSWSAVLHRRERLRLAPADRAGPAIRVLDRAEEVPFVGRADELQLLSQRLADARRGHARTVLIGGEAGVGKSRLLSRFAEIARQAGAHVLAGTCEEHFGDPTPYGPLLEVLESFGREYGPQRAAGLGGSAYRAAGRLLRSRRRLDAQPAAGLPGRAPDAR